jgi:hypothetical protein
MKKVALAILLLCGFAAPAAAMFGYASVPILPYRAARGFSADVQSGAVVTVYRPMADLSQAVSETGIVQSGAATAKVYSDRWCATPMANPQTLSDYGGPLDGSYAGAPKTTFSFYCNNTDVSILVVLPNGQRFGIQRVQVTQFNSFDQVQRNYYETYTAPYLFRTDFWALGTGDTGHIYAHPTVNFHPTSGLTVGCFVPTRWRINNEGVNSDDIHLPDSLSHPASGKTIWAGARLEEGNAPIWLVQAGIDAWGLVHVAQVHLYIYLTQSPGAFVGATANTSIGFGLGQSNSSASLTSTSTSPFAVLYASDLNTTPVWKIAVAKGGVATTVATLAGVTAPAQNVGYNLQLVVNQPGNYVAGFVNGVEGARITGAGVLPAASQNGAQFNVFAYTGTSSAEIDADFWYPNERIYFPSPP